MEDNQPISVSHEKRLERRQDDRRQQQLVATHMEEKGKKKKKVRFDHVEAPALTSFHACLQDSTLAYKLSRLLTSSTLAYKLPRLLTSFQACLRASKLAYGLPSLLASFHARTLTFLSIFKHLGIGKGISHRWKDIETRGSKAGEETLFPHAVSPGGVWRRRKTKQNKTKTSI